MINTRDIEKEFYNMSQEKLLEKINIAGDWLDKNITHPLIDEQTEKFRIAIKVYSERYSILSEMPKQEKLL